MKKVIVLTLLIISSFAKADSVSNSLSLSMPSQPSSYSSDSFRADGLECTNAIGSASTWQFGVTSIIQGANGSNNRTGDIALFSSVTIPIGRVNKNRLDCSKLYELHLRKTRLEVQRLEKELKQLRALSFEN